MSQTEEEFLKTYDPNEYDRLSLTSDILLFSVSDGEKENYRKLKEKYFSVLLVKREDYPFKGKWCLPGGFVKINETIEEATERILKKETNLSHIYFEQLYTYSNVKRDPRTRVVSTSYMALIDKNQLTEKIRTNASWFHIFVTEEQEKMMVELENGEEKIKFVLKKQLDEKGMEKLDETIVENTALAFDHPLIIANGIHRLKNKINYTDLVFHMMPEFFTLGELQQVYEVILGKKLLDPAFRRMIAGKVEKTDRLQKGDGHRPSFLYQYKKNH